MGRLLIVDDETNLCETLRIVLGRDGHEIHLCGSGNEARAVLAEHDDIQVVLTDLRMDDGDGMALLAHCRHTRPQINIVVMTAYAAWDTAVEAMRLGAWNFVTKPFDNNALRGVIRRAVDAYELAQSAVSEGRQPSINLVGNTTPILTIQRLIEQVGRTDTTVLITGESGTGKELAAHGVHYSSLRADGAFMRVNSGALTPTLLESELFGHVKGAFTGAIENRPGLFALADGGTLFLDEVGELSLETQVKLLRVLESGEYIPVGDTQIRHSNVRVIAATNRRLAEMVEAKTFREDLYYRLAIVCIEMPSLRNRTEDVPLLAGHLLARNARRLHRHLQGFSEEALRALCSYTWPGNIRELDNRIQRAIALATEDIIEIDDLFGDFGSSNTAVFRAIGRRAGTGSFSAAPSEALEVKPADPCAEITRRITSGEAIDLEAESMFFERQLVAAALETCEHNMSAAAKLLGLNYRQMRYKVKTLGLR